MEISKLPRDLQNFACIAFEGMVPDFNVLDKYSQNQKESLYDALVWNLTLSKSDINKPSFDQLERFNIISNICEYIKLNLLGERKNRVESILKKAA